MYELYPKIKTLHSVKRGKFIYFWHEPAYRRATCRQVISSGFQNCTKINKVNQKNFRHIIGGTWKLQLSCGNDWLVNALFREFPCPQWCTSAVWVAPGQSRPQSALLTEPVLQCYCAVLHFCSQVQCSKPQQCPRQPALVLCLYRGLWNSGLLQVWTMY